MTTADPNLLNADPGQGAGTNPPPASVTDPGSTFDAAAFASEGWREYIPEDLKERAEWGRVNNIQDVFKNYVEAQQTISKSVRIPDAAATTEELAAFYTKLGKPADKASYDFEYTPQEGYALNKESFDFSQFKDIADAANLTQNQYQAMATAYLDIQNQMVNRYNTEVSENAGTELRLAEAALRKEWGKDYATNINNISAKITQMYPEETIQRMENSGLFRDANFLKSQLALTKMMTGDTIFIEGQSVENVAQTVDDLRAKRDALMSENYVKNKAQVNELNEKIVKLTMAQSNQVGRR